MVLAATAVFAMLAPVATAAEVHFDPDSPAGKEYALPLDQARDEAAGGKAADRPTGVPAPLFGAGVEPRDGAPGAGGSGESGGQDSGEADQGSGAGGGERGSPGGGGGAALSLTDAESGDGYPLSSGLLLVAAVLLVGAGIGLTLRLAGRTSSRPA